MMTSMLHTETTRTVTCCSACGAEFDPADEPEETDACPAHGVELVSPVLLDTSWLVPADVVTATTLTTAQIQTVVAWLNGVKSRGSELTMHERDLLASCVDAQDVRIVKRWRTGAARTIVADAFNALQRGA